MSAAARPGRGQEPCSCCGGTGEHGDGSSCDRCSGTGAAPRGTRDPACPGQPQPRRKHWRKTAISHWQHRDCGVYAKALTDADPGLRIGAVAGPHSNPAEGHALHWFAHDDTHAYDSLGRHKLPYVNVWDSAYRGYFPPESHERMGFKQVLDVPPHHFGELTPEQSRMLPAARRHIREHATLEGRSREDEASSGPLAHQGVLEHFEAGAQGGGPFYHATSHELTLGEHLRGNREGYSYVTPSMEDAHDWAKSWSPDGWGHVHEVHPEGELEDDENWGGAYKTRGPVKVGREMTPAERGEHRIAGFLEHFEAGFEEASPQAREHREDRVSAWLDRNTKPDGTVPLPKSWGPHIEPHDIPRLEHHGWPADLDQQEDHWRHMTPERVSLRQQIHVHQPWVHRDAMEEKRDLDRNEHELGRPYDEEHARFVRHQGKTYLTDGHHRYARARLTGKDSMPGLVADTSRESDQPRNCPECREMHADDDEPMRREASDGFNPVTAWGAEKPHAAVIAEAQHRTREDHPMMGMQLPEPEWTGAVPDADVSLRHMLRRAGYPEEKAAGAWVRQKPETATASSTGYDPGDGTVGVGLHPHRWDYGTMAHEAAHLVANHEAGRPPHVMGHTLGLGDADVHGPDFARAYGRIIGSSWGKQAGDDFARHHQDALQLVSNYRSRVHKLPRIDGRDQAPPPVLAHFEAETAGQVDLYHHTTPENAAAIRGQRRMIDQHNQQGPVFFSDTAHGFYGGDYGPEAVHVRVPRHLVTENDSFGGGKEKFYTVRASDLRPEHFVDSAHQAAVVAHFEAAAEQPPWMQRGVELKSEDYDGTTGNNEHITRNEHGWLPTAAVERMRGAKGERPGEHRNRQGQAWDDFKADVGQNGIRDPLFITVDHGGRPTLSEGSHRRDAAVSAGHQRVPVQVRYYGNAQHEGTVWERHLGLEPGSQVNARESRTAAAEGPYVLYHGAHHDDTDSIQASGLRPARYPDQPTVTTSRDGAALIAGQRDWTSPRVVEIHVPRDQVSRYLGEPEDAPEGTVHALREVLPAHFIHQVHTAVADHVATEPNRAVHAAVERKVSQEHPHLDQAPEDRTGTLRKMLGRASFFMPQEEIGSAEAPGHARTVHELAHHAGHVMTDRRQGLEEARPRESWDSHPKPSDLDPDHRRHGRDFTWHYALALDGVGHRDAADTARGHYTEAKVSVANERHGRGLSRDFPGSDLSPHRPPDLSHLPPMIDSQREGLAAPDDRHYSRKMLDVASRPEPGLRLWRGERRPAGEDIPAARSVGMHWSAKPEGVITGPDRGTEEGKTRPVVWQSRLEHPEHQAISRSHPMWRGIHESMPSEAEVRLHPGSSVHVEGAWVGEPGQESTVHPLHPEHNPPGWTWHPVDHHIPVSHRPGQHGTVDYADVGIPKEGAALPEYHPEPEFVKAPEHLGEEERSEHFEGQLKARRDWKAGIRRGLSLGHLTPDRAGELGYHANGHDAQDRYHPETTGWHPMPEHLYHVTTDLPGVREHGLRSQRELGVTTGHGLGSSEPDTISMTDHEPTARGILSGLHEYHHFLNHGSPEDLIGRARRGDRGSQPFHHDLIRNDGGGDWKEGDPLPRGLDAIIRGKTLNHFFGTQAEIDKHNGPGWRPHPRSEPYTGRTDGEPMHSEWERDATPHEQLERKSQLFKAFSAFREHAGGPYNPGFMSNDVHRFAAMNPDHFALLHVRPKSGTQGYRLPGEHEWRTTTGDAVEAHKAERLKNGQPHEAALRKKKPAAPGHAVSKLPAPAVPVAHAIAALPVTIAAYQPQSAREAGELLGEVPDMLRTVAATLSGLADRCEEEMPVGGSVPDLLRHMAAHTAAGAKRAAEIMGGTEGAWKESSRQPARRAS